MEFQKNNFKGKDSKTHKEHCISLFYFNYNYCDTKHIPITSYTFVSNTILK